jgi:hypothetical protein
MDYARMLMLAVVVLWSVSSSADITAESARQMPRQQLAQKLLGESGAIMIDVDRPRYDGILEPIVFYSHATVNGSQVGICGSDRVTVGFDENGKVDTVWAERRYGVAGNTYREPGTWSDEEYEKLCASVTSTRDYFPAPDAIAAQAVVWYVDSIAGRGPFSTQAFEFNCIGLCAKGREDLSALKLEDIDEVRAIDCDQSAAERPSCFEITIGKHRIGPFPKKFRVYGSTFRNRIVVSKVALEVSSTLE